MVHGEISMQSGGEGVNISTREPLVSSERAQAERSVATVVRADACAGLCAKPKEAGDREAEMM